MMVTVSLWGLQFKFKIPKRITLKNGSIVFEFAKEKNNSEIREKESIVIQDIHLLNRRIKSATKNN